MRRRGTVINLYISSWTESVAIALHNGDPVAVRWMFQLLTKYVAVAGISVEMLKEQLETEYGVALEAVAGKLEPVTAEEKAIVEQSGQLRAEDFDWSA